MEFFNKAKAVRLRSHLDKYLLADDDEETVRQSRNGSSRKARWTVELVEGNSHLVRLKSCFGRCLTASDVPFLLGMTGKRVFQTIPTTKSDPAVEWEPIKDGFQVKLRTREGKFLRANGGTPPWRNSITHDTPRRTATMDWVLWDVDVVDLPEVKSFSDYQSQDSLSEDFVGSEPTSPSSMALANSFKVSSRQIGMELFHNAKAVRLKSRHEKYLLAEEDDESVFQDRNGSSRSAKWTVEFVDGGDYIRLKSCYGKYLTASNAPFLLGMTGRKVLQTLPTRLDSSVEWEPVRDGFQVKLKTRYGNFLRANGGLPPWRNSVTHDIPQRTATQDWVLWDVDIMEVKVDSPRPQKPSPAVLQPYPPAPEQNYHPSLSSNSSKFSKQESSDSFVSSPPKHEGRTIYYSIIDENGDVEDAVEMPSLIFKGNGVDELALKLKEETGLEDITVCFRNPLTGTLIPLRLQLPPNNASMHVVVVPSSSRAARDFARPSNPTMT